MATSSWAAGTSVRMRWRAASALARSRQARMTVAPARASSLAVAAPMPELAPVKKTVLGRALIEHFL